MIISGTAFDQTRGKVEVGFEDLGPQSVKNVPDPVRAYRVLLDIGAFWATRRGGITANLDHSAI